MTTTQAGDVILAFISSDGSRYTRQTFSSVTGGGLTWTLRQRSNAQRGTSEIWQAVAPTVVSNLVVTATRSSGSYVGSMVVTAFAGADVGVAGATLAASGRATAPSAQLTPTKAGSWVWAVGNDWDRAAARTIGTGQTKVDEFLPSGKSFWVQRQAAPNAGTTLNAVTINATAPTADRWNLALIEVPASAGTPPADTTAPTVALTAPAAGASVSGAVTVAANAADNVGVSSVQFQADGVNIGAADASAPYNAVWDSTTVANGSHTVRAVARDAAGNTTTSTAIAVTVTNATGGGTFTPGNPSGTATIPVGAGLENVSAPDRVVGDGTAASCTSAAVVAAVAAGGVITFNCGANPITITLTQTLKVLNSTQRLVIDGGGKVTLSGGNTNRILYIDTCDTTLGKVSGNCLYAPTYPQVTVQNMTLADGNATNSTYVSPGDTNQGSNGGGAIFALGGRLKVVNSVFVRNTCAANGPDLGGAAVRVLAQHSATPNDLDSSYAARNQDPVYIVNSTFGGSSGQGNNCSNGGAISGLRTPITVLNTLISYNNAIGCCANPAWSGTPGGGSGGAIYTDGTSYDLKIAGSLIERNTAKAGGSSIFYVSNDKTGHLIIDASTSRLNTYAANGQPNNPHFETYPGIFYIGSGSPTFTNSTIQ
ncbi:Ig-like domain-containing protein [Nakamurella sp.]|uniref:Ig-like domain-containing protein n=1 Tax=Nakamurella sp. TaxID=1869182 RepID=UPI0037838B6E